MHPVVFLLKRGHLKTVEHAQALVRHIEDMTPARFDIMCFLRQSGIRLGELGKRTGMITQRAMLKGLGLHASTLSKMLTRLEELGWITRERDYADQRVNVIKITELGLRRTWKAMRTIFRQRLLLREFEELTRYLYPTRHVIEGLTHLTDTLDLLADAFNDQATFYYSYGEPGIPFAKIPWSRARAPRQPRERLKRDTATWLFNGVARIIDG